MRLSKNFILIFLTVFILSSSVFSSYAITIEKIQFKDSKTLFIEGTFDENEDIDTLSFDFEPNVSDYVYDYYHHSGQHPYGECPYENHWEAFFRDFNITPGSYTVTASINDTVKGNIYAKSSFEDKVVTFEDPNLEAAIRDIIRKPEGVILKSEVEGISELAAVGKNIRSIEGIQNLTGLESLTLSNNQIEDITCLSSLKNLWGLRLNSNNIKDISVLKKFSKLNTLLLLNNPIDDLSSVEDYYTNLEVKDFYLNEYIEYNILDDNDKRFGDVYRCYTDKYNGKEDKRNTVHIQIKSDKKLNMENRDVIMASDSLTMEIGHDDYFIDYNSYKYDMYYVGEYIYDIYFDIKDKDKGKGNGDIFSVILKIPDGNKKCMFFPMRLVVNKDVVEFKDITLEYIVRGIINKFEDDIYKEDVEDIMYLPREMSADASFYYLDKVKKTQNIKSLEGIENLKNLKELYLHCNDIEDIEPLRNLTNLEKLNLDDNKISDIACLENFTNLRKLELRNNKIINIEPLRNLTNLEELYLENFMARGDENCNQISDITPLENLINLKRLYIDGNNINDISILSNLTGLEGLELGDNDIEDIKPLSNIKGLIRLDLNKNRIKDISILKNLNNLRGLYLGENNISDISSLSNLNNLDGLRLSNNNIKDITALANLEKLEYLCLDSNNITDITPLTNLMNLEYLYLASNDITDYTPVSKYYKNLIRKDFEIRENTTNSSSKKRSSSKNDNELIAKADQKSFIETNDIKIEIPVGASNVDTKLNVQKVSDLSKLKRKSNQKYIGDVYEITKDREGNFDKMITITLPFDKTNLDTEDQEIGIFWFNEDTKEWIKLDNIKVDVEKGIVSGDVNHFTKFTVLATEKIEESEGKLKDIQNHWAENNINQMIESGIITGYKDSTFKPNNNITRAEFCKLIVKAFNLDSKDGKVFIDTKDHWAKGIISTAQANGIASGYDNNMFRPNDLITREEMAVMIVRAAKLDLKESNKTFDDDKDISSWAKGSIKTAIENNILNGYPKNKLKPKGYATRAEAVTMIIKAINF